jgi:hypothetical protein
MEAQTEKYQIPESGGATIPLPVQSPEAAPTRPAPEAEKAEGLVNLLQVPSFTGPAAQWYLLLKAEADRKENGIMLLAWEDGRVIAKSAEPVLFDVKKKICDAEAVQADLRARKDKNDLKLVEAEKLRKFSDIERIAGRIRELTTQIENGKKALEYMKTVTAPAALKASIEAKQKFFDMLKTELDRIDSEIGEAVEFHSKITAKPASAKPEPKQAGK